MKSHVRTPLFEVAFAIVNDAFAKCPANKPEQRDLTTIKSRVEKEGISFLTITLPAFGAAFDHALSVGQLDSRDFRSFRKFRAIPAFLRGMTSLVFDLSTGRILDEPSIDAIESIREISYCLKKVNIPCSDERVGAALAGFVQIERDLQETADLGEVRYFRALSRVIWGSVFRLGFDPIADTIPKHGPGATQERVSGNRKFRLWRWYDRLEPYFPFVVNLFSSENCYGGREFKKVSVVPRDLESPVRVITVPKTLKTPRIIAIEPVCMQYTQQALSRYIVRSIERSRITRGHVNFRDQTVNMRLALSSSSDRSLATIDLSSASDRVPAAYAGHMLSCNPILRDSVFACRSKKAELPDGTILSLRKFASMGSALCFPIESMFFYTLCIGALLRKRNLSVTWRNAYKVSRQVYVYGDDIIIPTDDAESVIDHLHKNYCKVGTTKSHWIGKFRESCGVDAYDGCVVTPTYVRKLPPSDKREASAIISWVKTANQFYRKGYWNTASMMWEHCERLIGKLPVVGTDSSGLGRISFLGLRSIGRWNRKLHRYEVRAMVPRPVYRKDELDGEGALLKCLLNLERPEDSANQDRRHLERTARHGAVALKRRWIPV